MPCQVADAQFLRLGPFDFAAQSKLEGIYTTNVEGERPSEADEEMEDYYVLAGLDLSSQADMAPSTSLRIDTGISIERHFVRTDLDDSSSPFARGRINSVSEFGRYTLTGEIGYDRKYGEEEDEGEKTYVPGGRPLRDVTDTFTYGAGLKWERTPFLVSYDYGFTSERHQDEAFQDGDQDETTLDFMASWRFRQNMSLSYENGKTKTELLNNPEANRGYKTTETIALDAMLTLIKRPQVTYSLGLEKEDTDEEKGTWEPIHTLSATDEWDLSPTLRLSANARYTYEPKPEVDDIAFTYGAFLDHEISPSARESLNFTREPVSTFGATTDTDSTTYGYRFTKNDLFIYNLGFALDISYEISNPLGEGETEKTWNYRASLAYSRALSRKLSRELKYGYSVEDSNLEDELLEEHRVTLSYVYTF
ncbi:MAG: hypothetical protein V1929_13635 [bacterium]